MRRQRYPVYIDSGLEWLGQMPEHWKVKRLRFVAQLNPSKNENKELSRETEVSFVPMEAIGEDGGLNLERTRPISEVEKGYTYFRDGDVTLAKITPCFENGKGAVMQGLVGGMGFGTTELIVVRPLPLESTSSYLYWLFMSPSFRRLGEASMYGAGGQKRVPDSFVRDFKMAFPPIAEQRVISTFLNQETAKIDALMAEQARLIELLKEKRQAVISHAVTKGLDSSVSMRDSGIEWIGQVPETWEVCKLGFRYSVELGKMLDAKRISGKFLVPYLRNQDVQWGSINIEDLPMMDINEKERDRYTVQNGDLLVCEGGDVGRAAVWTGENNVIGFQKALHRVRPRNNDSDTVEYFYYALIAAKFLGVFEQNDSKATISHLPAEKFRQCRFAFPPLEEQIKIFSYLNKEIKKIDKLVDEVERAIELLKERRTALISAAVTGKIDVRGLVEEVIV